MSVSRPKLNGYTVVDAVSVLATHLTEIIKQHAAEILGRQETQNLLDNLHKTNAALVDEVVPNLLTVGEVQKVLANLLHERISIRDMSTILEVLADYGTATKDTDILTEYVRHAMARHITQQNVQNGILPASRSILRLRIRLQAVCSARNMVPMSASTQIPCRSS